MPVVISFWYPGAIGTNTKNIAAIAVCTSKIPTGANASRNERNKKRKCNHCDVERKIQRHRPSPKYNV